MGGNGISPTGDLSDVWLFDTQNNSLEFVADGPLTHCTWGNPCGQLTKNKVVALTQDENQPYLIEYTKGASKFTIIAELPNDD